MREHLVIVGGGQSAAQAAQTARQSGYAGRISLISEEPGLPYQRPPLSKQYLSGEMPRERLALKPEEFYTTREIELLRDARAVSIDPGARTLELGDGTIVPYTDLILATGSSPRRLSVPGAALAGIHYLRSIDDANAIKPALESGRRLVIVGAGFIGLEVAAVAIAAGLRVTVLEAADRVMARGVSAEVSDFYASHHRGAGIDLRLGAVVAEFRGNGAVRELVTAAGERIECDFVIAGIGVMPRIELAAAAGLAIENGIRVDANARASAPHIYAAGDCTSQPHPWVGRRVRLESVNNAIEQAKAAAATAAGRELAFDGVPWFWSDQYALKLQIAGLAIDSRRTVVRGDPGTGRFSVYHLDAGGCVVAVDSVNDPREFIAARKFLVDKPRWPVEAIADPDCELTLL